MLNSKITTGRLGRHLSRLKTRWNQLTGKPLHRQTRNPKVIASWRIQEAGEHVVKNPLESLVYGDSSVLQIAYPDQFLYELKDVWLSSKQGFPFFESDCLFPACPSVAKLPDHRVNRPVQSLVRAIEEPIFHLTGGNAGNRAHFLVEQIPRLLASRSQLPELPSLKFLLVPERSAWQRPILKHLGIAPEHCLDGKKGTLFCKRVFYAPMLCETRDQPLVNPALYLDCKQRIETSLPSQMQGPPAIFISRRDAPDRQLDNEEAVVAELRKRWPDLTVVRLTGMPLAEQIDLFRNARIVFGPHGQGFHNALFCKESLVVQLNSGTRETNPTRNWCDTFSTLAIIAGNHAITLYSDVSSLRKETNWTFPLDSLNRQLASVDGAAKQLGLSIYPTKTPV